MEGEEGAQDMEAAEDQEAEELAEMVRELEMAGFCNVHADSNFLYSPIPICSILI